MPCKQIVHVAIKACRRSGLRSCGCDGCSSRSSGTSHGESRGRDESESDNNKRVRKSQQRLTPQRARSGRDLCLLETADCASPHKPKPSTPSSPLPLTAQPAWAPGRQTRRPQQEGRRRCQLGCTRVLVAGPARAWPLPATGRWPRCATWPRPRCQGNLLHGPCGAPPYPRRARCVFPENRAHCPSCGARAAMSLAASGPRIPRVETVKTTRLITRGRGEAAVTR